MVRVAVLGCGGLGVNVAGELAYHGHEVRVFDAAAEALDRVQPRLAEDRKVLRECGLLQQPGLVGSVYCMSRLEDAVREAELVLECISEELGSKVELMEAVTQCCRPSAVLTTSTMRLGVDAIFERASGKERCLGMRFLFPVYAMPEVELQLCRWTSMETLSWVRAFLERMAKTAFFRAGSEPLVLSEPEREARRTAAALHGRAGAAALVARRPPTLALPDLASPDTLCSALTAEVLETGRDKDCVVCMDEERNCVLHPCHHLCTCAACGRVLLKRQDACPICRRHITSIFRVFHS
ncbi:L-carnitine dehydrogenase [Ixodes scapularis]|nr:L-carnitine dehydrogenase [Ixodes scapularis]XP_029826237.2 L-carnitine dehydrogenase [Ixodes scapularis]XP_042146585.1 L-carnitine dehydrogenase [Ixodes scapularis]